MSDGVRAGRRHCQQAASHPSRCSVGREHGTVLRAGIRLRNTRSSKVVLAKDPPTADMSARQAEDRRSGRIPAASHGHGPRSRYCPWIIAYPCVPASPFGGLYFGNSGVNAGRQVSQEPVGCGRRLHLTAHADRDGYPTKNCWRGDPDRRRAVDWM